MKIRKDRAKWTLGKQESRADLTRFSQTETALLNTTKKEETRGNQVQDDSSPAYYFGEGERAQGH